MVGCDIRTLRLQWCDEREVEKICGFDVLLDQSLLFVPVHLNRNILPVQLALSGYKECTIADLWSGLRDILVGILTSGIEKGVLDPPKIDGKRDLKAMAMALLDQCTHISMWYTPGGQLDEEQMATLYAEMALRSVGAAGK